MILLFATLGWLLILTLLLLLVPFYKTNRRQALWIGLYVTVASVSLYALLGAPRVVPLADQHQARMRELYEQIKVTSAIIEKDPDNLEAWLTLSQALSDAGDYKAAANGFKQAVLISKGHPRIIMAYAESLIMEAQGRVTPQAKKSIDIALMIDPKLPIGRYYHAIWMLQEGSNAEAMQEMKTLYHELPDDSTLKKKSMNRLGANGGSV